MFNSDMLLVIDIGNTNIVFGVYRSETLVNHWRLSTDLHKTVDEYAILLSSLLSFDKIGLNDIQSAVISCVVPPLLFPFERLCRKTSSRKPYKRTHDRRGS